ncbi:hypothetical protein RhiXN_05212 [Rhizoctonia solani]|uniref:Uncharacterized protein n=1 Tax=Rhizoctonia solani TaxID=456999 RepID=A0A8H8NQ18_9AGAM|nr:uncharacterized protein RhiXN_05212 [Rhizoctonia solani]QRW17210.1 hypothetical protein RhiXN_05212 [Rhizoctonia solani]
MRTQENPTFVESDYEEGDSWQAKLLADADSDSDSSQNQPDEGIQPFVLSPDITTQVNPSPSKLNTVAPRIIPSKTPWHLSGSLFALRSATFETFPETLCKVPTLSRYFPHCTQEFREPLAGKPVITPDFITLSRLQSRLEYVMEDSASSSLVAIDIKDSEMALRDLVTRVKVSSLSSKEILGRNLELFVEDARVTSGNLQQFGSRVWGAVDRIVSLNEHTLVTLEVASLEAPGGSLDSIINFFAPAEHNSVTTRREIMEDLWLQAIEVMDKTLRKLIHEAQDNVGSLQRLKEKLDNIQDMAIREEDQIRAEEEKTKRDARWSTRFKSKDQGKQQNPSASLELLQTIQDDRKRALNHVADVLFKLEQMSQDLHNLREGVATPLIIAGSAQVPIESHIKHIRSGTDRLMNGQTRMRGIEDEYRRKKFSSD